METENLIWKLSEISGQSLPLFSLSVPWGHCSSEEQNSIGSYVWFLPFGSWPVEGTLEKSKGGTVDWDLEMFNTVGTPGMCMSMRYRTVMKADVFY